MPTKPEVMLLPQGPAPAPAAPAPAPGTNASASARATAATWFNSRHALQQVIFVDCDDCLYQNDWATAAKITTSIAAYTANLGVSEEKAYALYKAHGTCLKGMLAEGFIASDAAEDFLLKVHEIDYSDVSPDPALAAVLGRLAVPAWIFTASTKEHALRCMARVGVDALPWRGIVDTRICRLETKHSPSSFQAAMDAAGVTDPGACLLCDDSVKNINAAKAHGWRTVLVGTTDRDSGLPLQCEGADLTVPSLHNLPEVAPELFS